MSDHWEDFKQWLRDQPDKPYDFASLSACLVSQYLESKGLNDRDFGRPLHSAIFPGVDYSTRIKNYHLVCNPEGVGANEKKAKQDKAKKMTVKNALMRAEPLER